MMATSKWMIYTVIIITLINMVPCFCPHGCDCRHTRGGQMDLFCEQRNLRNFVVIRKAYKNINSIHLRGNYLEFFNGTEVSKFSPKLSLLDLKTNRLTKVRNGTFKGFWELKLLDISKNNIAEIDSNAFSQLVKLNQLNMRHNKIKIVKDIWFRRLNELKIIDLKNNLIEFFLPPNFRWPVNLKILFLQGNYFHVLPPLPRRPDLVDLSDNTIDCSCQRHGQEKVDKDILLNVRISCNKISKETWRKQHWKNPFCRFPTVNIEYKKFKDGLYLVICTGDGFPPPTVSLKHKGEVIAAKRAKTQLIYSLIE